MLDELYSKGLVELFVLDEMHCVKSWGDEFRPVY